MKVKTLAILALAAISVSVSTQAAILKKNEIVIDCEQDSRVYEIVNNQLKFKACGKEYSLIRKGDKFIIKDYEYTSTIVGVNEAMKRSVRRLGFAPYSPYITLSYSSY